MAFYYPIANGTIRGKRRIWSIVISERYDTEQDPPPTNTPVKFRKQLVFQYSNPSGGALSKGVMPSFTTLDILDWGYRFYERMRLRVQTGAVERAFKVECTSRDYSWTGYAQLDEIQKYVWYKPRLPVTSIQFADGLADIEDLSTSKFQVGISMSAIIRNTLAYDLIPLDILYKNRYRATNAESGTIINRIMLLAVSYPYLKSPVDRVMRISDNFLFRIWQGLDSRWHIEQPWLIGRSMGESEGAELWEYVDAQGLTAPTIDVAISQDPIEITESKGESSMLELLGKPVGSVEFSNKIDWFQEFTKWENLQLARDGLFVGWSVGGTPLCWGVTGTVTKDTRGVTPASNGASIEGAASSLWQYFKVIDEDEEVFLDWTFWAAIEGTTDNFDFQIRVEPIDVTETTYYLTSDGEWTATVTVLNTGSIAVTAPGNPTLTYTELFVRNIENIPVTGYPVIEFFGIDASNDVIITDVFITPVNEDGEPEMEGMEWESTFVTQFPNADKGSKEDVERIVIASETRTSSDLFTLVPINVRQRLAVYRPTEDIIISADAWYDLSFDTDTYYDLAHILADSGWFRMLPSAPRLYRGKVFAIAPPEKSILINGVEAIALNVRIDGVNEVTEGDWMENLRIGEDLGDPTGAGTIITI